MPATEGWPTYRHQAVWPKVKPGRNGDDLGREPLTGLPTRQSAPAGRLRPYR